MSWGRNYLPDILPRLRSYSDALYRHAHTTPLCSGEDAGLIPLGSNRRYKRSQILKVETTQGIAIFCRFWNTDVVKFYEDGSINFHVGGWNSPSTLMFLQGVCGNKFTRYKGKIYYKQPNTGKFFLIGLNGLRIDNCGVPINPSPETSRLLNRNKWKGLLEKVKAFSDYSQNMTKFLEPRPVSEVSAEFDYLLRTYGEEYWNGLRSEGGVITTKTKIPYLSVSVSELRYSALRSHGKEHHPKSIRAEFISRVLEASQEGDPNKMYPLMFVLQISASDQRWSSNNGYMYECNPAQIKRHLMELLKFEFCETLFDSVVQPCGELVAGSNSKYFIGRLSVK